MIAVLICVLILGAALFAQESHYEYLEKKLDAQRTRKVDVELEKVLTEFQDYKKRVDALTLKAGFKL